MTFASSNPSYSSVVELPRASSMRMGFPAALHASDTDLPSGSVTLTRQRLA
ncbi:hypothetical protein [Lysobacter gummosus]